jgi:hypothetical protein
MAEFDFQKLGLNRLSQNIKRAVTSPAGVLTTGDITKGEIVDVELKAEDSGSATVAARRTGALLLGYTGDIADIQWTISGTKLVVTANSNRTSSFSFWVF